MGTIHAIVSAKNMDPSFFFLALLVCSFLLAGILHPYEFYCLTHGLLYFLSVPAGYLVLVIYSLSNMNCVSWGTREVCVVTDCHWLQLINFSQGRSMCLILS